MAQPVDFVGLNTFLYEPCGWDVSQQSTSMTVQNESFTRGQMYDSEKEFFDQYPVDFDFRTDKLTIVLPQKELVSKPIGPASVSEHFQFLSKPNRDDIESFVRVMQNNLGCTNIEHPHLAVIKNYNFSLQLPDPQTGLAPVGVGAARRVTASFFHALMLKRNGPYGYPTWKQLRASDNPLTRIQRRNNVFTYVREPGEEVESVGSERFRRNRRSAVVTTIEDPLTSKFKPLEVVGGITSEDDEDEIRRVQFNSTFGNETVYFDNSTTNNYFGKVLQENDNYQIIKDLYLDGNLDSERSPLDSFEYLRYTEVVYPAIGSVYRNHVRSRPNYNFTWRNYIADRIFPSTAMVASASYFYTSPINGAKRVPSASIYNGFGFHIPFESRWVMDSGWNYDKFMPRQDGKYLVHKVDSIGRLYGQNSSDDFHRVRGTRSTIDSSSVYFYPIGGAQGIWDTPGGAFALDGYFSTSEENRRPYNFRASLYESNSAGGEGQLMNSYCQFTDWRQTSASVTGFVDNVDLFLTASMIYSRKHMVPYKPALTNPAGMSLRHTNLGIGSDYIPIERSWGGSTEWQAGELRRVQDKNGNYVSSPRTPFDNSYKDFAEYTKIVGKDYSVVPEFRISNHIERYEILGSTEENLDIFEVSGSLAGSSDSSKDNFYKIYSNSDFMKHFEIVKEDHKDFVPASAISLKCKAIKKFLPYDGFYPAQRSVQLGKQFFDSYSKYFKLERAQLLKAEFPGVLGAGAQAWIRFYSSHFRATGCHKINPSLRQPAGHGDNNDPFWQHSDPAGVFQEQAIQQNFQDFHGPLPPLQAAMPGATAARTYPANNPLPSGFHYLQVHPGQGHFPAARRLMHWIGDRALDTDGSQGAGPGNTGHPQWNKTVYDTMPTPDADRPYNLVHNFYSGPAEYQSATWSANQGKQSVGIECFNFLPDEAVVSSRLADELLGPVFNRGNKQFMGTAGTVGTLSDTLRINGLLGYSTSYKSQYPMVMIGDHLGNYICFMFVLCDSSLDKARNGVDPLYSVRYNNGTNSTTQGATAGTEWGFENIEPQQTLFTDFVNNIDFNGTGLLQASDFYGGADHRNGTSNAPMRNWFAPAFYDHTTNETLPTRARTTGDWAYQSSYVASSGPYTPSEMWGTAIVDGGGDHWSGFDDGKFDDSFDIKNPSLAKSDHEYHTIQPPVIFIKVPPEEAEQEYGSGNIQPIMAPAFQQPRKTAAYYAAKHLNECLIALKQGVTAHPQLQPIFDYFSSGLSVNGRPFGSSPIQVTKFEIDPTVEHNIEPQQVFISQTSILTIENPMNTSKLMLQRSVFDEEIDDADNSVTDTGFSNDWTEHIINWNSGITKYHSDGRVTSTDTDGDGFNDTQVVEEQIWLNQGSQDWFGSKWNRDIFMANNGGTNPLPFFSTKPFPGVQTVYGFRAGTYNSTQVVIGPQGRPSTINAVQNVTRNYVSWTPPLPNVFLSTIQSVLTDVNSIYCKVQPMITPLFAPGVLFNTIKSGIACDYPLMTDNVNRVLATVSSSNDIVHAPTAAFWMIGGRSTATSSFVSNKGVEEWISAGSTAASTILGGKVLSDADFTSTHNRTGGGWTAATGQAAYDTLPLNRNLNANNYRGFNLRIPFEALIEPENHLANTTFINQEPDNFLYFDKYLRLEYETRWGGQGDLLYKKMAHNFLAEIPEFFLLGKEFKRVESLEQGNPTFGNVGFYTTGPGNTGDKLPLCYKMRVKIYRSMNKQPSPIYSNGVHIDLPQDYIRVGDQEFARETLTMYSRASAFGPPSWDSDFQIADYLGNTDAGIQGSDSRRGYNFPFTPPYYHGEAWADITFKPDEIKKYTLAEIINSSSVDYYRYWHPYSNTSLLNRERNTNPAVHFSSWTASLDDPANSVGNFYGPQHPLFINDNAMQINASLNLFGQTSGGEIEEIGNRRRVTNINVDSIEQNKTKWVIQPKFETPILNFNHISASGDTHITQIEIAKNPDVIQTAMGANGGDYNNSIVLYDGGLEHNLFFWDSTVSSNIPLAFDQSGVKFGGNMIPIDLQFNSISAIDVANGIAENLNDLTIFEASVDTLSNGNPVVNISARYIGKSNNTVHNTNSTTVFQTAFIITNTEANNVSGLKLNKHAPEATTVGMWHQYGVVPSGQDGVFMRIDDVPLSWQKGALGIHTGRAQLTASLADLCGFSKEAVRLGEMAQSKRVSEAVVAVPFIEDAQQRKFFEIPRRDINNALDANPDVRTVGRSIIEMTRKMKKYVFPPPFDFIKNTDITPFAMYIFEFHHVFSRQDLVDMWQNLPPDIGIDFQTATSTISHDLLTSELIGGGTSAEEPNKEAKRNDDIGIPFQSNMRWMVFKVKQRAKTNYYDKVVKKAGVKDEREAIRLSKVSYNWPYDFFSLVELVKLESSVVFAEVEDQPDNPEVAKVVRPKISKKKIPKKLMKKLVTTRPTRQSFLTTENIRRPPITSPREASSIKVFKSIGKFKI